jgi:hypothetical protein
MQENLFALRFLGLAEEAKLWESTEMRFSVEFSIDIRPTR